MNTVAQKIKDAFEQKDWSQVILLTENEVLKPAYDALTIEYSVADIGDIPNEKVFEYFAKHDIGSVLLMKGTAALGSGDPMLASRMFADAQNSSNDDMMLATAYMLDAMCKLGLSNDTTTAHDDLVQAKKHDPSIGTRIDTIYNTYISSAGSDMFASQKEEVKKQLELL